jgi:AcrR family transcriptional regulator
MQRMVENVKPRAARTRATRRRIVDAAAELFIERGYGTTTLEQIAARAGVAVQTVYFHFGNKRTVLKEAVDVAAVGDDEPVALLERSWFDELRAEPDPRRMIALWVAIGRSIYTRIGPIMAVVRDAAVTDPDMATQWAINEAQRVTAYRAFADLLDQRGALNRPVDEAVDVLCALVGPEVYGVLTGRGWSPEQWERFTVASITAALLR